MDLAFFQSPSLRGSGRFPGSWSCWRIPPAPFNPLHCGAVVASRGGPRRVGDGAGPFNPLHCGAVVASGAGAAPPPPAARFQSPSLRGSGRFPPLVGWGPPPGRAFNPLHCGAVVASRRFQAGLPRPQRGFQSPSLRGSGRFYIFLAASLNGAPNFQSPSLRGSGRFSPRSAPSRAARRAFNPLHCGAVVASYGGMGGGDPPPAFQSPSLRGSGRFGGQEGGINVL